MGDNVVDLPDYFSQCDKGKCEKPSEKKEQRQKKADSSETVEVTVIWCEQGKDCKGACMCRLFRRGAKDKHKNDKWEWVQTSKRKPAVKDDDHIYECVCVKPVLPDGCKLCDCDDDTTCDFPTEGKTLGKMFAETDTEVWCDEGCPKNCNCELFRVPDPGRKAKPSQKAADKWERVAGQKTKAKKEKGFVYQCFCVK